MDEEAVSTYSFETFLDDIGLAADAKAAVLSWQGSAVKGNSPLEDMTWCCQHAYQDALPEYHRRGIPKSVAVETFMDIPRWVEDHREKTGQLGLVEAKWLEHHIKLELFALGGLQYQLLEPVDGDFTLAIHIPKAADISPAKVDESLAMAMDFFNHDRIRFTCSSWLLSSQLSALLDDTSRIKVFSSRFTRLSDDMTRRQAEERIFGCLKDDPMEYDVRSSLAKKARAFLMEGGILPVTTGYFILNR